MKKRVPVALISLCCVLCLIISGCGNSDKEAEGSRPVEVVIPDGKAANYGEAYQKAEAIRGAIVGLVSDLNSKHNASLEEGDPNNTESLMYSIMLMDMDLAFTAPFKEDKVAIDSAADALIQFGLKNVKVQHPKANSYGITFTGSEGGNISFEGVFDPDSGSLRFDKSMDKVAYGFYEFVDLGNDKFAYQTDRERAYVEYKNKEVVSFEYSTGGNNDAAADSIYPGGGVDAGWVTTGGASAYAQVYSFKSGVLKIDATLPSGDRVAVEIRK